MNCKSASLRKKPLIRADERVRCAVVGIVQEARLACHKVQRQVIECFVNTVYVFEDKIIVNLNLRDGDKPIALSKENGSDIETCGSPKGAVAHPLKKKDRSKSQKRLYNFGLLL
mgnify:CR=1 FL=1